MLRKRLTIPSETFSPNPIGVLKSLLGEGVTILKYEVQSIVLSNSKIVVDVEYEARNINPLVTYYVKTSDLVMCTPTGNAQVFKTEEGIPVWFKVSNPKILERNIIPVLIAPFNPSSKSRRSIEAYVEKNFKYFAIYNPEPLHAYSTFFDTKHYLYSRIDVDDILSSSNAQIKRKEIYNMDRTNDEYSKAIHKFECLNEVTSLKLIKKFDEIDLANPSNIGYLMDAQVLPSDRTLTGIIVVQPIRQSNIIFYYPHLSREITMEEIQFTKDLVEIDKRVNLPPIDSN